MTTGGKRVARIVLLSLAIYLVVMAILLLWEGKGLFIYENF